MVAPLSYNRYPVLEIDLDGIYHNARAVVNMCRGKVEFEACYEAMIHSTYSSSVIKK